MFPFVNKENKIAIESVIETLKININKYHSISDIDITSERYNTLSVRSKFSKDKTIITLNFKKDKNANNKILFSINNKNIKFDNSIFNDQTLFNMVILSLININQKLSFMINDIENDQITS